MIQKVFVLHIFGTSDLLLNKFLGRLV